MTAIEDIRAALATAASYERNRARAAMYDKALKNFDALTASPSEAQVEAAAIEHLGCTREVWLETAPGFRGGQMAQMRAALEAARAAS